MLFGERGGGGVIGLFDVLCAVCDGVGDGYFLGGYEGRSLEAIYFVPYLLVVTDRQSPQQKLRYDISTSQSTCVWELVRAVISKGSIARYLIDFEQCLTTKNS